MLRKLASVQRVLSLEPIPNADAIVLARINGWQCIVKKTDFEVGDLGVFFEIDSIPPDIAEFAFLWTSRNAVPGEPVVRPAKFRIRTMKMRGALSQGLLMPLSFFALGEVAEGDDLTESLGVEKYEIPVFVWSGPQIARGPFPSWLRKTDEMRIQSVPEVLDEIRGLPYVCTLKYDGTSATFTRSPLDGEFHVCSRNLSLLDGDNAYWRLARELDLARVTEESGITIQGELCGPGIQKNHLGLKKEQLFVFNAYSFEGRRYLNDREMREFCARYGLTPVDVVERGEAFAHTQESLLSLAEGLYPNTRNEREGVVIRPENETYSPILGGRLSFKAVSNRYLLKEGD
ncbi:RNA ligase (ATP) [bacterium]|nr:MAG: RNA ligase (ATP) [bacterium]